MEYISEDALIRFEKLGMEMGELKSRVVYLERMLETVINKVAALEEKDVQNRFLS